MPSLFPAVRSPLIGLEAVLEFSGAYRTALACRLSSPITVWTSLDPASLPSLKVKAFALFTSWEWLEYLSDWK